MKKIINKAEDIVLEMARGIVRAHPELALIERYRLLRKKHIPADKVVLISGGGSGHEPAHGGFIGEGMLDCAVCGDVFASPSQVQVYNAIKLCATKAGVLLIVKNYSGDCMNFNNAAERAREEGIAVELVYVNDDIAVQDSLYTVGRRGVAGTVWVHKVAGAAAAAGKSLAEVKQLAEETISSVRSLGFAFSSCTPPAKGSPIFDLAADEMEFGVGIHGEPGRTTEKFQSADALAKRIVHDLCEELQAKEGNELAVIINGFGATPIMELYLLNNAVSRELEERKLKIHRTLVGNYMTSLDMEGASISLLQLNAKLSALIDAPVATSSLHWGLTAPREEGEYEVNVESSGDPQQVYEVEGKVGLDRTLNTATIVAMVQVMADVAIKNEQAFCDADRIGDGDFGSSIAKGFRELKKSWPYLNKNDIGLFLKSCSEIIEEFCGGASGPIWGSAFFYAGKACEGLKEVDLAGLAKLLQAANTGIYETGKRSFGKGAVVGDKTIVDALKPCADALEAAAQKGQDLRSAISLGAEAAAAGAEATKDMQATLGRAANLGEKSLGHPDAGAYGLSVIFAELAAFAGGLGK